MKNDYDGLLYKQSLPLIDKILLTQKRLRDFYNKYYGRVYISFSGGKDSTVLLHIARKLYPNIKAVFVDTGLEYPEIKEFVKTIDNVIWLKPETSFNNVIKKYGYPLISKEQSQYINEAKHTKSDKLRDIRLNGNEWGMGKVSDKWKFLIGAPFDVSNKCCDVMKKRPVKKFEKENNLHPIIGIMADESNMRKQDIEKNGCNIFDSDRPMSRPLSFWKESDIWEYIKTYNINYSKIYDMGYERTGCMFCGFGLHLERNNRFDLMKKTHPKIYEYIMSESGLNYKYILDYVSNKGMNTLF